MFANLPLSCQRKNLENRLIVGEVMDKSLVSCFLTHGVVGTVVTASHYDQWVLTL